MEEVVYKITTALGVLVFTGFWVWFLYMIFSFFIERYEKKPLQYVSVKKITNKNNKIKTKNIMNYYTEAIKKYVDFKGRATRAEYWYFFLFNLIIGFVLGLVEGFLGVSSDSDENILANLYSLFVFLPSIAVGVRRMHDVNKSGWFIIVPLYNLILAVREGDKGTNRFGEPRIVENINNTKTSEPQKYCSNCGQSIDVDSKFCIKCGTKTS